MKQIMASDNIYREKKKLIEEIVYDGACKRVLREIKSDQVPMTWQIFLNAMYRKKVHVCCILLSLQNIRQAVTQALYIFGTDYKKEACYDSKSDSLLLVWRQ